MGRKGYDYKKVYEILKDMYYKGLLVRGKATYAIDQHLQLPTYTAILEKIAPVKYIKDMIDKGIQYNEIELYLEGNNRDICSECAEIKEICGKEPKKCESEADLYYSLGATNNVMEFCKG